MSFSVSIPNGETISAFVYETDAVSSRLLLVNCVFDLDKGGGQAAEETL